MQKKTDLEKVKTVARALLMTEIHETEFSPAVVQHPFTSSGITILTKEGIARYALQSGVAPVVPHFYALCLDDADPKEREIEERAKKFGTFSYDALTTEEFNGEDILVDSNSDIETEVRTRYFTEKLRAALSELTYDERILITLHYYKDISESELAKKYGISQQAISKRIKKIREKLKSIFEK